MIFGSCVEMDDCVLCVKVPSLMDMRSLDRLK